jgi:Predicted nucleic acid-binding protein, contains PIN domain
MILLDSNIVIYSTKPNYPELWALLSEHALAISEITRVEVLGYHRISAQEKWLVTDFLATPTRFAINEPIIEWAIQLRQQRNIGLGDAVIAATALLHQLPLVTHNTSDFRWIPSLELIDPLAGSNLQI